jgi:hypothetical protein
MNYKINEDKLKEIKTVHIFDTISAPNMRADVHEA